MTTYQRVSGAVEMTVDDTLVVVDPSSEQMVTLNGVASLIWSTLAEPQGLDGLVSACHSEFPEVDEERIRTDVTVFLAQAAEVGVIAET